MKDFVDNLVHQPGMYHDILDGKYTKDKAL